MQTLLFFLLLLKDSAAFNKLLIGTTGVNCSGTSSIAPNAIMTCFFKELYSLAMIDFTAQPLISTEICTKGKVTRAFKVFNDLNKMNFGNDIDKSGLSEYPRTHGIHMKGTIEQAEEIIPRIAKHNPRMKLLIFLVNGSYEKAEKVLRDGYNNHKMLNIAILMAFYNHIITFCLYNPYAGDDKVRRPEFKSWNVTRSNYEEVLKPIEDFIENRVRNLQKYPLKVAIFTNAMHVWPIADGNGAITRYKYPDGDLIHLLSQKMNFTPIYSHPGGEKLQGFQLPNGSFTGSLGMIESGEADYSANSLLISSSYNTSNVLFINSMEMEQFVFVIKKRQPSIAFRILLFSQFDKLTQGIFIAMIVLFPIIYTTIIKMESKMLKVEDNSELIKNIFYMIALQLNISMRHQSLLASRFLIAAILFLTLIMNSIFQGTIVSSLSNFQDEVIIKTMEELINEDYKFVTLYSTKAVLDGLGGNLNEHFSDSDSVTGNSRIGYERIQNNPKLAFLHSKAKVENIIMQAHDNKTNDRIFQEVPEVVFEFFVSPIVPKSSPFIEQFKEFIMRYKEFGLRNYQASKADYDKDKFWIHKLLKLKSTKQKDKTIELEDLKKIMRLYCVLNGFAFLAFIVEWITKILESLGVKKKFIRPPIIPLFQFLE